MICHWPHSPRQVEVQQRMESVQEWYATFLLCTPDLDHACREQWERKRGSSSRAPPTNAMRGLPPTSIRGRTRAGAAPSAAKPRSIAIKKR